jgi:hypothetical protein
MSNENEVPVAVTVSTYGLQDNNNSISVYAQPVSNNQSSSGYATAIGYASPPTSLPSTSVQAQAIPQSQPSHQYGGINPALHPVAVHFDDRILRVMAMARSVKCLAVLDLCLILILAIFQFSWIFLIWGPISGYFGTNRYKLQFLYVYVGYWALRALTDAVIAVFVGYWWFLVSLLVDLYILRYIWQFCVVLKSIPPESLLALQTATDTNQTPAPVPTSRV